MERFDIYKGLLGLRAINLFKKVNKSGKMEHIVFEASSALSPPQKFSVISHNANNHLTNPFAPNNSNQNTVGALEKKTSVLSTNQPNLNSGTINNNHNSSNSANVLPNSSKISTVFSNSTQSHIASKLFNDQDIIFCDMTSKEIWI